jgi:hypothetical protein
MMPHIRCDPLRRNAELIYQFLRSALGSRISSILKIERDEADREPSFAGTVLPMVARLLLQFMRTRHCLS